MKARAPSYLNAVRPLGESHATARVVEWRGTHTHAGCFNNDRGTAAAGGAPAEGCHSRRDGRTAVVAWTRDGRLCRPRAGPAHDGSGSWPERPRARRGWPGTCGTAAAIRGAGDAVRRDGGPGNAASDEARDATPHVATTAAAGAAANVIALSPSVRDRCGEHQLRVCIERERASL